MVDIQLAIHQPPWFGYIRSSTCANWTNNENYDVDDDKENRKNIAFLDVTIWSLEQVN